MLNPKPMSMLYENGKRVTCEATIAMSGPNDVALIFWRRNDGALLPLRLTNDEALRLGKMLTDAASAGALK